MFFEEVVSAGISIIIFFSFNVSNRPATGLVSRSIKLCQFGVMGALKAGGRTALYLASGELILLSNFPGPEI